MPATGNVWTWPDPVRGDDKFTSPAYSVWENAWSPENQWYDNWNQNYGSNESWRDINVGGQFDDSLYSFTKQSYDPYRKVTGYEPKSGLTYARIMGDIQGWLDREHPELSDFDSSSGAYGVGANSTASIGGAWEPFDKYNADILKAQQQVQAETGVLVPGNVIKAIMRIEAPSGLPSEGPAYGLMQVTSGSMGSYDLNRARTDAAYGIWAGTNDLALRYQDAQRFNAGYGWRNVAVGYFSGHYEPNGAYDGYSTDSEYLDRFSTYLQELDNAVRGGNAGGYQPVGNASSIIAIALKYVGQIPYPEVWTGNPGKGDDPMKYGGWDCSGFTYWLDQNYGTGALPQGSHFQYQYAQQSGQLFTNQSALQAGDLVFFDTGITSGGGAELNHASHVGIYMGPDANGVAWMVHSANPNDDTTVSQFGAYKNQFIGAMHSSWSGGNSGYGSQISQMDGITGGVPFPLSQEFGRTSYSEGEGAMKYKYGLDYGLDGYSHPGLDIAAPLNTPLYSPVNGTVVIAGGVDGFSDERFGATPGTGELLIQLDNGEQLILGHMSYISVKVGDPIIAGQPVGNSGTSNGAHYHLEWRVPGANTSSGYQIVDPRTKLGGSMTGSFGQGTKTPYMASADDWSAFMRATAEGKPVTGYTGNKGGGSFHDWMRFGMQQGWNPSTTGKPPGGASSTIAGAWGIAPVQGYQQIMENAQKAAESNGGA